MRCSNCEADNAEGSQFCNQCAAPLRRLCSKCAFDNVPDAKFCAQCAEPLGAGSSPRNAGEPRELTGERRHLTVLFCDLVGSTEIAAKLDPEDWRETVASYQRSAAEAITRFGGHVAKYLGDGVVAFFGYPEAHDNDAERAARAGLAILDAISKLNENPARPRLSARVGIDSGGVVVGAGAAKEVDVFGDTPNIAARVEAEAESGTVLITDATHQLVSGLFVVEDRGSHPLKGIERPIRLYRVIEPSGVHGRLDAAAGRLTPFVGREDELRLLMNRWERALEGEGQVALIIGEAGIGKSRLMRRFHQEIAEAPHTWVEATAGPLFQYTPFYSASEMLRRIVTPNGDQPGEEQLEVALERAGLKPAEAVPLLGPLLSLSNSEKYPPLLLPGEQQRRALLATLLELMLGAARALPLVIVTEDLHWADPSTLELIALLVESGATARLLLLYTARPEFSPPWQLRTHHTQMTLNRLSAGDVREMIGQVAARNALASETVDAVIERTSGVPLFVEELTRAVLEGGLNLVGRAIPVTLHDSLMARLDRLGPAKEVAQVGAVIGSEFSYELLHAVSPISADALQTALAKIADAELIYARGFPPEATYQFKHALMRDAAYEALLRSRRKDLHRRVARAIDEKFAEIREAQPEVLARHLTEAGETEPALAGWQKAGGRAVDRLAYREAEQHYREALALLSTLADSSARDAHELTLQLALGGVLVATRGFSAVETAETYKRARILAELSGGSESLDVFFGMWNTSCARGELHAALALADQLIVIARAMNTPLALVVSHYAAGLSRHYLGDLTAARQHLVQAIEHYREEDFSGNPNDVGVNSLLWAGINESYLGYPDTGLRYSDEAISLSRRLNKPFGLAFACGIGALDHAIRGDFKRSLEASEETVKLGTQLGFPLFNTMGKIGIAWVRSRIGETTGTADQIREGLAAYDSQKFFLARTWNLRLLAEVQALSGMVEDALLSIEQALQTNPSELLYRPDVLRLRGELRLRADTGGETSGELAESDFHEAIDLARQMNAKSIELRTTTSLARLLRETGRRAEAREALAEIYNWFNEGFDTADLKDAKALLDELKL